MKFIFSVMIFVTLSFNGMAQMGGNVDPKEVNKLADAAKGMKLDKATIGKMIDLMVQTGKITPEQAKKAKEELEKQDDKSLEALKQQAIFKVKNGMQKIPDMKGSSSSSSTSSSSSSSPSTGSTSSSDSSAPEVSEEVKQNNEAQEALNYLNN